ncbi:flavoprotein [Kitasatospora sp. NBC_00240]|uniref:flavoprotein n=1 Tax=Kitasatospora sp. NBC_00240 TaxID=2903567 RepID=UPI0022593492|nr:flavoprotein [Kitasatospora sp. NBC_00240]MCX5213647.1 flavoprotein [Kitasatospora sp. NBC_00240]
MPSDRVLHLLGSAAEPVLGVRAAVAHARALGWDVCLGLTPTAADWLREELDTLAELTGYPVKSRFRRPGDPEPWPAADAVLVAPATFNTLNSWALGITDTWVVGHAAEAIGKGVPLIALPRVNSALAAHPQFGRSLATLREAGVELLPNADGILADGLAPLPSVAGPSGFPWAKALAAVERAVPRG